MNIYLQIIYIYIYIHTTNNSWQTTFLTSGCMFLYVYIYIYITHVYIYICVCIYIHIRLSNTMNTWMYKQTVPERRLLRLLAWPVWTSMSCVETFMRLLETHSILGWLGLWSCALLLRPRCYVPQLRFLNIYNNHIYIYIYIYKRTYIYLYMYVQKKCIYVYIYIYI